MPALFLGYLPSLHCLYPWLSQVTLLLYESTKMRQLLSKSVMIDDDDDDDFPWRVNAHKYYVHVILSLFLFTWFILGNYWVFSVYMPNFLPPFHQPQDYCNKTLYIFATAVLVLSHIILFMVVFCSCCIYWISRQRGIDDDH
ncbi:transmembrane protein 272 isoform X2 [Ambystoma mexicanum]|uniref:transmembrane protein 272 isoform X2 n=1 Tax=Ambystoma mexicanum TaxID=8296 RepID=UPI0037E76C95